MSEWNYCHGPNCHTYHTQSRIRGVKGNKVLRTRKVSRKSWWNTEPNTQYTQWFHYFCDDRCKHDFLDKHLREIIALEPRSEALETSIEVQKKVVNTHWGNRVETEIIERT
jgi:hypothetical protein